MSCRVRGLDSARLDSALPHSGHVPAQRDPVACTLLAGPSSRSKPLGAGLSTSACNTLVTLSSNLRCNTLHLAVEQWIFPAHEIASLLMPRPFHEQGRGARGDGGQGAAAPPQLWGVYPMITRVTLPRSRQL